MLKIINHHTPVIVSPAKMKRGQVGIIRKWLIPSYTDLIVMKTVDGVLVNLDPQQERDDGGWRNVNNLDNVEECAIELLPEGTKIEITV